MFPPPVFLWPEKQTREGEACRWGSYLATAEHQGKTPFSFVLRRRGKRESRGIMTERSDSYGVL